MQSSQVYIAISIVALAIVGLLVFFMGKSRTNRLTPLAGIAFGFIIAGVFPLEH
jgi:hypothetical protein